MGRLDTAGFFKNLAFHGHSKKKLVPLDNDDYGNPTDPCDKCPEGYECDNGECVPVGPGPTPPPIDPEPIPIDDPTKETECRRYASRGSGIKYTENNTWTGYDWDSGSQWTFRCAESITFYGRLNHTIPHGGTYLVNDIRWGVGNLVRSFIVPENESLEQSIFRFNVNVDGTYLIEIKKKASGDYYYPWEVWEAGKLPEADGKTLYMGVSALAEIWGETIQFPDEIDVLYEGAGGRIIHNKTKREVTLIRSNGEELTIMDRNLGATAYMGQSGASTASTYGNYYQWGNNHPFTASGNQFTTTQTDTTGYSYNNPFSSNLFYTSTEDNYGMATHQDWANPHNNSLWGSGGSELIRQGPCADGWHIPNSLEMSDLFRMWGQITGIDIKENFNVNKLNQFCRNTLTPKAGLIRFTGGAPGYTEDTAFYWTTSVTQYNESNDSAYRGYASQYGLFVQPEGTASRIPAKCYGHPIRPFKNKTDVPKYTIRFLNYDGTVLQSSRVYSGLLPQYIGATPTRPGDAQHTYIFTGWTPTITTVTGDADYTATFIDGVSIFSGPGGNIIHDLTNNDIILTRASDGVSITIADADLGQSEYGHCNNNIFYQWGNNNGFWAYDHSGQVSTDKVNVSGYGPSEFSNNVFIKTDDDELWYTPYRYNNLWGEETNTEIARRGPCPEGYHVPDVDEMDLLLELYEDIIDGVWGMGTLPYFLGMCNHNCDPDDYIGSIGHDRRLCTSQCSWGYWTSDTHYTYNEYAYCLVIPDPGYSGGDPHTYYTLKSEALRIRPFKNTTT